CLCTVWPGPGRFGAWRRGMPADRTSSRRLHQRQRPSPDHRAMIRARLPMFSS
ncbi:MAG: hypothetical protein AVDCRST_MAG87-612, partial [uncultured Thermomicrobiales bacterium]